MTKLSNEQVLNYLLHLQRDERPEGTAVWVANNNIKESEIAGCDLDELCEQLDDLESNGLISFLTNPTNPINEDGTLMTRGIILSSRLLNLDDAQ